jgi:phospholipid/cholesterol/gamma-HCH transport system substrate-binding protein
MSKAFRLGAFIIATLLVFAGGIFLIGSKQFLFNSTYHLKAQFQNAAGLTDGAEVRVGGLRKGTVKHIELPKRPDGKITVAMELKSDTRNVVKTDSVASIEAEGLVGDKYVEISFGSDGAKSVKDGSTIQSEKPVDVSDVVKKANAMMDTAKDAVQNLDATSSNLQSITTKVDQGKGSIGALLNDKTMYQHVNAGATDFQEDMEALKHNFLLRGFFKKRGYEDTTDLTKHQISKLPAGPYSRMFEYEGAKIFDKQDSAKLKNQKTLNEAGKFLEQNNFGLAVVAAYSGMKGDTDKDRVLSEARAMVVREYLVNNFKFDDTKVETMGIGKTSEEGNSGVEILVYPPAVTPATARSSAK